MIFIIETFDFQNLKVIKDFSFKWLILYFIIFFKLFFFYKILYLKKTKKLLKIIFRFCFDKTKKKTLFIL